MRTAVLFSALSVIEADFCVSCRTRAYNFTEWEGLINEDCWDDEVRFEMIFGERLIFNDDDFRKHLKMP